MPVSDLPLIAENLGANATSTAVKLSRSNPANREGSIYVVGNFSGSPTVTIQASPKVSGEAADDWFDVSGGSFTAKALKEISLTACRIRVATTGGDGSTNIDVYYG
jgi:hypothetical protein